MWTKQHQTFCPTCGRTTNHVTRYQKDDGGSLVADVRCTECPACPEGPEIAA